MSTVAPRAIRSRQDGLSAVELLVALSLVVLVVVFTGRVIVTTLALLGRGTGDVHRAARARSEAAEWIQAVTEYTRKVGFAQAVAACTGSPCQIVVPAGDPPTGAPAPFDRAPGLPRAFQCGRLTLWDWDGPGGRDPATLRLLTVEVFRQCNDAAPFLTAQTGIAAR